MGKMTFDQLSSALQEGSLQAGQIRFCSLTKDIVYLRIYPTEQENPAPDESAGEVILTLEQFENLQTQFPQIPFRRTGTFPIPTKK